MTKKKKASVVAEDILHPQVPHVLTPDGSVAQKAINVQTSVTKDDMASLIHVNVRTQLNNELNTVLNSIKRLEAKKQQVFQNAHKEICALLINNGYLNPTIHISHMHLNFQDSTVNLNHTDVGIRTIDQELSINNKLKGKRTTRTSLESINYTNQEIQDYIKEMNELFTQKTNIERNLNTANKEYIKANIIASLIGSSDKGQDFIKNISNIGISIIESLKSNTIPLIAISQ